jgi:hypothetical protein
MFSIGGKAKRPGNLCPMEGKPPAVSLLNLLNLVQKSPAMYVGAMDSARGVQLDRLEVLIEGYSLAVNWHGLEDPGLDLYNDFSPYLERRFAWNLNRGPIRAIRDAAKTDGEAWDNFWRLLWEFRDATVKATAK